MGRGDDIHYDDVLQNVKDRDFMDSTREDSPLRMAKDAIEFDNSSMDLEEQFEKIQKITRDKIAEKS